MKKVILAVIAVMLTAACAMPQGAMMKKRSAGYMGAPAPAPAYALPDPNKQTK